jgi:hypothetical protein
VLALAGCGFHASPAAAANHYVRQGGSGASPCADWTNACNALPTLVSGDTYYFAAGTYAAVSITVTNVTFLKATVADHGTSTGWSDSYANGLAHFSASGSTLSTNIMVGASGFVMNGQTGSLSATNTDYGFQIDAPSNCAIAHDAILIGHGGQTVSGTTVEHTAFTTCTTDIEREAFGTESTAGSWTNVTFSNNFLYDWQGAIHTDSSAGATTVLFERNYLTHHRGSATHHAEWVDVNNGAVNGFTIRYNIVTDSTSTACLNLANNTNNAGPTYIYGNVFANDTSGNGIATVSSGHNASAVLFYNNTIYNKTGSGSVLRAGSGTGNVSRNNLYYDCSFCSMSGSGIDDDYGAYFGTNTNVPTEAHREDGGAGDPTVNAAAENYRLTAHTTSGLTLPSPYDVDPDGKARGATGVWDRGAYAYGLVAPAPPTNVRIIR